MQLKRNKNVIIIAITIVFLTIGIAFSGCTTTQSDESASQTSFTKTVSLLEKHYKSDGSCYYTSTIDIKNTGKDDAKNVMVRCNLKESDSGSIADTKSEFFEVIDAGDHKVFTVNLDGDCDTLYGIGVDITEDYR